MFFTIHQTLDPRPNECITQQKINDFRTHVTRYEGTFYNNNVVPVSLANKIWVNFTKKFVTANQSKRTNINRIYVNTVDIFNDKVKVGMSQTDQSQHQFKSPMLF